MKKRSGVKKPVWVFAITLSAVILVGLLVIAAVKFYWKPSVSGQEEGEGGNEAEDQTAHVEASLSFWENVSDGQEVMAQAATPEPSRYGKELADVEYRKANRIYAWEADREEEVTLGFVGDI
ncbi:MAG: hypothetical protein K2P07_07540, partial [Lachnospiraceae bacterium]|nr:hypothetical protein [Lachnospiraceae bacterium]